MNDTVQTWHYGLVARHWAENNTTGPEIAYYQRQIEKYGQPHWMQAAAPAVCSFPSCGPVWTWMAAMSPAICWPIAN